MKEWAPEIMKDGALRKLMSKGFTEEEPYSQVAMAQFRTTDRIVDTRVRKTTFGYWEE